MRFRLCWLQWLSQPLHFETSTWPRSRIFEINCVEIVQNQLKTAGWFCLRGLPYSRDEGMPLSAQTVWGRPAFASKVALLASATNWSISLYTCWIATTQTDNIFIYTSCTALYAILNPIDLYLEDPALKVCRTSSVFWSQRLLKTTSVWLSTSS